MAGSSINATGGGNTVQALSEDGDISAEVGNISYIRTGGGGGGNALFAETVNGSINATFTGQGGIMSKESEGANGFLAQTQTGDITATFDRRFSGIFMYPRGKHDTYSNGKGATFTSVSGNISVLLTNTASIFAPSLGDSYGLAAQTGEDGDINIALRNGDSCIAGRSGAIARTAQGDINFHLSDALIVGSDGYGINAISAMDGNIAIVGERGSVISGGIYAATGGVLSVTSEGEDGLNVWTNEDSGTTIRSTGRAKIFNSKVWANGARAYTILASRGVEITGAQVWSNGAGSISIRDFGRFNTKTDISGSSRVWANGADSDAVATFRVTAKGSQVWVEGDNSNAILAYSTADISGGSQVWANGADSSAVSGATATVNIASGSRVWANGVNSSAVSARTANISGGSQVWANGANSDSLKAADADISGSRVWTEGDNSNAVVVTGAVNITSGSQVWANGANSSAVVAGTIFVNQSEGWRESGSSHVITGGGGAFDLKLFDSNIAANGGGNGSLIFVDGGGSDITVFASNLTTLPFRNTMDLSSNGGVTVNLFNGSKLNRGSSDATTLNALGKNRDVTVTTTDSTINAASGATALRAVTTGSGKTRIDINGNSVVAAYGQPEADGGTAVRAHSQTSEVTLYMRGTSKAFTDSAGGNSVHLSSNYTVPQNPPSSHAGGNRAVTAALEGNASISASGDGANALFIEGPETTERLELVMGGASKIFVTGKGNAAVINSNGKVRTAISGNSQIYAAREGSSALFATSSSSSRSFDNLDIGVSGAARIFTNGADSDTIRTSSAYILDPGGVLSKGAIFRLEDEAQIYSDGDSSNAIYHVQHTRQRDVDFLIAATAKLFANGADSFALHIREDSQTITGRSHIGATVVVKDEAQIYATGDRSVALRADMNDGDLIYVNVSGSAKIFTNGDYSSAVEMDLRHKNMTFNMSESAQVSTAGNHSTAINAAGDLITPSLTPVDFFLHASNTAQILAGDADSTAVRSQMVDGVTKIIVSGKSSITAQGSRSDAINATSLGNRIGIYLNGSVPSPGETDSSASVYLSTSGNNSGVVRTQTVDGDTTVFIAGGSKVFASGDMSRAISAITTSGKIDLTVGGQAEVRAEGEGSLAVFFTTTGSGSTKITTESGASVTGNVSLSENRDVFHNNGSFTGSGDTGDGDDVVNNKGTFTLTGDFDMGAGDDSFVNIDGGMVIGDDTHTITPTPTTQGAGAQSSPSRHSVPDTESSITPSASGDSRFRLSSPDPSPEDTTATINFGDGDDHFINNGTIVIQDTGGFNGLEKITFGDNSTVMVTADSTEMTTDKPLIELEGEITAEDVKYLNIKLANPERHSDEFALFSETALPDSETERQAVLSMISGGLGEGSSAGVDSNGNIFIVLANSVHFNYLRNYDAMIQSAYHSDTSFSEKLRGSCYGGEAETQDLRGGCLWADAGSRHTRHDTKVKYGEDAYVFAGGFSIPAGQSAVSIGAGYETSDFNAGTDT
ncbi:MAG: beta strand repeat-containing protein, partial [Thermodesulfobacteriota bacterium]